MTPASNGQPGIIRTERGLTIARTRITLYDVMDYVTAQYPPKFIRSMLNLTDVAIASIEHNVLFVWSIFCSILKIIEALVESLFRSCD